ncbi:similar to high light inducible protein [Cyanidioschyzon merolae strain 10D]|uniref:Similar to high light inducible protein n=1 Tax=Cyanidioschyzon merolae (strain NIES-3377 / 10D) TaxID=280699 RepID=M1V653_CYAM1|nr:similar to high light inducible protein [Cyanidioschyzon merolae strain 10D]BAM81820.1 similar to high light inducible protein [Cyanidioschyzon merolae strain 10D]|eukprot:XP_005537856.1 similar to high light inducible protein [Cyanidioschyzon merolae strain 10D]
MAFEANSCGFCSHWLAGRHRRSPSATVCLKGANKRNYGSRVRHEFSETGRERVGSWRSCSSQSLRTRLSALAEGDAASRPGQADRGPVSQTTDSSSGRSEAAGAVPTGGSSQSSATERVPGRYKLSAIELAEQRRALRAVAERYKAARLAKEAESRRVFGFCRNAEVINGRTAMFFFVTGMLTEYWTGQTMPQQIELLLRILGIIE